MKIVLFLLGLMMGSFAFGQNREKVLQDIMGKSDDIMVIEMAKENKLKSYFYEWGQSNKCCYSSKHFFDKDGKLVRMVDYKNKDTNKIVSSLTIMYFKDYTFSVDSSNYDDSRMTRQRNNITYKNIYGQDSLEIDSTFYFPEENVEQKTYYEYDYHHNLVKMIYGDEIEQFFYDSLNRIIERKSIDKKYTDKNIFRTTMEYQNRKIIVRYPDDTSNNRIVIISYDEKDRVIKMAIDNDNGKNVYIKTYDDKNLIKADYNTGRKFEYFYQNTLPIKIIEYANGVNIGT